MSVGALRAWRLEACDASLERKLLDPGGPAVRRWARPSFLRRSRLGRVLGCWFWWRRSGPRRVRGLGGIHSFAARSIVPQASCSGSLCGHHEHLHNERDLERDPYAADAGALQSRELGRTVVTSAELIGLLIAVTKSSNVLSVFIKLSSSLKVLKLLTNVYMFIVIIHIQNSTRVFSHLHLSLKPLSTRCV